MTKFLKVNLYNINHDHFPFNQSFLLLEVTNWNDPKSIIEEMLNIRDHGLKALGIKKKYVWSIEVMEM